LNRGEGSAAQDSATARPAAAQRVGFTEERLETEEEGRLRKLAAGLARQPLETAHGGLQALFEHRRSFRRQLFVSAASERTSASFFICWASLGKYSLN
jgi:hypothetical protein